jgi:hypothetical protein
MARKKIIENLHYLGVKIERNLWIKLRIHADGSRGNVGELVRKILTDWVNNSDNHIK